MFWVTLSCLNCRRSSSRYRVVSKGRSQQPGDRSGVSHTLLARRSASLNCSAVIWSSGTLSTRSTLSASSSLITRRALKAAIMYVHQNRRMITVMTELTSRAILQFDLCEWLAIQTIVFASSAASRRLRIAQAAHVVNFWTIKPQ
jgi:hypothetical protein